MKMDISDKCPWAGPNIKDIKNKCPWAGPIIRDIKNKCPWAGPLILDIKKEIGLSSGIKVNGEREVKKELVLEVQDDIKIYQNFLAVIGPRWCWETGWRS